nr:putative ribonuclease H-like domain-containing protein [Tanacetum cinerariifolium]
MKFYKALRLNRYEDNCIFITFDINEREWTALENVLIRSYHTDVIENGNSFKLVAKTTTNDAGTSTTIIPGPVTIEEKAKKTNDVKARNLDTMSLDDLYNNFKIAKQEVRGTTSTNTSSQNMAFVPSPSLNSTSEVPTVFEVSTANPQVSTTNLSDATVYAFLANQPNGSQLVHEDLEQIHEDDLEEMDLKWQLAILKYRVPINQENKTRNQETTRMTMNMEDTSSKAMVEINGASFDWSYMADDEAPTNMAFMALSDSELYTDNTLSYSVVPPPYTGRFSPLRIDLSRTSLPEFAEPSVKSYRVTPIKVESDEEDEVESPPEERKNVEPSVNKVEVEIPKQNDKPARRPVKYAEINLIADASSSLVEDCWELNVRSIPTFSVVFPLPVMCSYCQKKFPLLEESSHCQKKFPLEIYPTLLTSRSLMEDMLHLGGAKGGKINGKGTIRTATKDETSRILKSFITEIENLVDKKVKIIRCDNGTKFKNRVMNEFCEEKGIKRKYSVARTPQQNGVAKRRNKTLIEIARTMLADSKLPITFWAKAVNTTCYVHNRVLVVKPHFKTPYELFRGRTPALSFMRPFGCHVTILNTLCNTPKLVRIRISGLGRVTS